MGYIDLHDKPFDETTISKLEIFQDYTNEWLPTFIMQDYVKEVHIFDFFAGTGFDINGVPGSPMRILSIINSHLDNLKGKGLKIHLHFNEFEPNKREQIKFESLKKSCSEYLAKSQLINHYINLNLYNQNFEALFPKLLYQLNKHPSLIFLDQNGIKFLSAKYFKELEKTSKTDFLYFVSSSYFWRFGKGKEFKVHLDVDIDLAKKQGYKQIHRTITQQLKNNLPANSRLKLHSFSLKKGANIHGIIFGASHLRAVDKFLAISWRRNRENGNANFDIDDEATVPQLPIFGEQRLTKIQGFKKEVKDKILNRELITNADVLEYTYSAGHIPSHATEAIKELGKKVSYEANQPLVSYNSVFKQERIISYKVN